MPRFHISRRTKYGTIDAFMIEIGGEKLNDELIVVEKNNNHYVYNTYTPIGIKDFFVRKFGFAIDNFESLRRSIYVRNMLKQNGILLSTVKKFVKNRVATFNADFFGKNYLLIDRELKKIYPFDTFEELANIFINEYKIEMDRNAFLEVLKNVDKNDNRALRQYLYFALYKATKHSSKEKFCQSFGITPPALKEILKKMEKKMEIPKVDSEKLVEKLKKLQEKLEEIKKRLG